MKPHRQWEKPERSDGRVETEEHEEQEVQDNAENSFASALQSCNTGGGYAGDEAGWVEIANEECDCSSQGGGQGSEVWSEKEAYYGRGDCGCTNAFAGHAQYLKDRDGSENCIQCREAYN